MRHLALLLGSLLFVGGCDKDEADADDASEFADSTVSGTFVDSDGNHVELVSGFAYYDDFFLGGTGVYLLPWKASCAGQDELDWISRHGPGEGEVVKLVISTDKDGLFVPESGVEGFYQEGNETGLGGGSDFPSIDLDLTEEGPRWSGTATWTGAHAGTATFDVQACSTGP